MAARGEPWWVRAVEFGAVVVVMVLVVLVTRDTVALWPLSFVALAALRWKGPYPPWLRR